MPAFKLGNDGKQLNEEYHRFRENALRSTFSIDEWGDIEITKYDLENLEFTGKENRRTYIQTHAVSDDEISVSGHDIRENPQND